MIPGRLSEIFLDIYKQLAELNRRLENRSRTGTVTEIDPEKGLARVQLSEDIDGKPFLTGWIPWEELSMGAIKTHFPPAVGEQVKVKSESGDLTDATISTSLPSNANPRPHNKAGEAMIKIGGTSMLFTSGTIEMSTDHIKQTAGRIDHDQRGGGGNGGPSGVPVA